MNESDHNREAVKAVHPALPELLARMPSDWTLVQVQIRRRGDRFELRHVADQEVPVSELAKRPVSELRALAQVTAKGDFRPLKSAPTLQQGWHTVVSSEADLEEALSHLYPGAVADWHAAQQDPPPVTHYREFTGRQTGMYRATHQLDDKQAALVARAVCHRSFCLKQRLWTVGDLGPESGEGKSVVPCLEPCAILMEFARKARRWNQEEETSAGLSASMVASIRHSLDTALEGPESPGSRAADFDNPGNRRRLRWVLEQLREADQNCRS
jgi:hypothetical protein